MQIANKHWGLLQIALQEPHLWVAHIRYLAEGGNLTERTVSPLKLLTNDRLLVYCLGREAVRSLRLSRILIVRLRLSMDVLPPEGVKTLVEHKSRAKKDFY